VIDAATVTSEGCDDAAPVLDAVVRNFDEGAGFAYETDDALETVEMLDCPLVDGEFDLDACEGQGVVGTVDGNTLTWDVEEVVVDEAPCRFTLSELREVVDNGLDGVLTTLVAVDVEVSPRCRYTFEGEPVEPDGCEITVDAELNLSSSQR
jgi:hypothetical protein